MSDAAAALEWMAGHGIAGGAHIPRDETGEARLGGQVVVEPADRETLRFVLDESALMEPGALTAATILGPGIEHDPRTLIESGFVHRVRCVRDGVHRQVQIGTQHHGGTDWFDLDDVELTPDGLSTPTVAEIRRLRTQSVPIGARAQAVAAGTVAAPAPPLGVLRAGLPEATGRTNADAVHICGPAEVSRTGQRDDHGSLSARRHLAAQSSLAHPRFKRRPSCR
ncbi:hypothetical protein ACIQB5_49520 [Streptomyces sp. NPDC088560]|uniref:hypothetical protein n=1 Tax=Streptomyces sp. NPDC088560 TaxID=3365868 RepID=UPI0037FCED6F